MRLLQHIKTITSKNLTRTLKNLEPEKTWTLKNLEPEKKWTLKNLEPEKSGA